MGTARGSWRAHRAALRWLIAGLLAAGVGMGAAGPATAADDGRAELIDRIVSKADPTLLEVIVTKRSGNGRPTFERIAVPNLAAARQVVASRLGKSGVRAVEMNHRVSVDPGDRRSVASPGRSKAAWNDPLYQGGPDHQWALDANHLKFDAIANLTRHDTTRPYVAVIDSGVQGNHPDLSTHMVGGYDAFNDVVTGKSTYNDNCGHGTHVAGIIAAGANNGIGIIGMAPRAFIRSVKVLDGNLEECTGDNLTIAYGIIWAAEHAHVLNLSLGSQYYSDAIDYAVQYALDLGRVVVAAAGNCEPYCKTKFYPAALSGVVGVAASRESGARASFSSYGWWVDVMAPGEEILSTFPNAAYAYLDGTSMAAPHVSAAAALGIQHCHWGASRTVSHLISSASHASRWDNLTGYGFIRPVVMLRC